ncbi:hypothetical protein MCBMB27_01432 [Methylobacterium phyllosphaerae]|uniref:Uncharacterized protein n=1 Tax=Methylobacterium phyllosphaerae TaxID=418223 RepID=A0AAE8HN79_9HYPH|nr:hypothetical protein [Methylobacterium phyllosphaerae]APT30723.1 hypothetical protein MCBMB27_01432 [Methylobacterium phyllosphaerae]SFG24257.1 hypothetical protein SAMN05192567_101218 [Methylobacterium phyllosphaerae]
MALAVKRDARMGVAEDMRWLKPCPDEGRGDVLDGAEGAVARAADRSQRSPEVSTRWPENGAAAPIRIPDPQRRDRR